MIKLVPKKETCDPAETSTVTTDPCTGKTTTTVECKGNDPAFPEDVPEPCDGPVPTIEAKPCGPGGSYLQSLGVTLQCTVDTARRFAYHETGLRPYRVFLVWRRRRRDIAPDRPQRIIKRVELVPVNVVALDATDLELTAVGLDAIGGLTLTQISARQVSDDDLRGKLDGRDLEGSEEEFFYEVLHRQLEGQTDPPRRRYILASEPHRDGEGFQYVVNLKAQAENVGPDGEDQNLPPAVPRGRPELVS